MLEHITWYTTQALLKIAPNLWGKPRLAALVVGVVEEIQELENAIWARLDEFRVSTASLPALKRLARIVDQPVTTGDVETLRDLVRTRVQILRSRGRLADILVVIRTLVSDSERVRIVHSAGAEVWVEIEGGTPSPLTRELAEAAAHTEVQVWPVHSEGSMLLGSGTDRGFDDVPMAELL